MFDQKILRKRQIRELTSLSDSTIRRLEALKQFPQRIQVGLRVVGWYHDEVMQWLETRRERKNNLQ